MDTNKDMDDRIRNAKPEPRDRFRERVIAYFDPCARAVAAYDALGSMTAWLVAGPLDDLAELTHRIDPDAAAAIRADYAHGLHTDDDLRDMRERYAWVITEWMR